MSNPQQPPDPTIDTIDTDTEHPKARPRPKCAAILNGLLRSYKAPRKAELFVFTPSAAQTAPSVVPGRHDAVQRDHFFEIQHVVDMLFADDGLFPPRRGGEDLAMYENLASWVVLSVWLNDAANLYPIKADFNQRKRQIPLERYFPGGAARGAQQQQHPEIAAYLAAQVDSPEKGVPRTVEYNIMDWASRMAMYGNHPKEYPDHDLIVFLGSKICERMGWKWLKTTSWTAPVARGARN